ncbi:heptaprenylglyceryl phosphate synthase [Paenibacillus doosanensis]|uniref:heptaprenylglyceryl phosphate synthase n=1 Tax=Paenibacillus doosanensis TaxID=1229154 RepID=UPI00217FF7D8|nr:heptaprenylglyceryl phosphate synthase [Paenibacillus doosanensis]MCS7459873.1 heptaprenylglyceryl phosphate synthase [Paenibacillus doosanensis]
MHWDFRQWNHIFKLDPDKDISDELLDKVCLSGTDAIIVGGSSGVTFDNTVDLLSRIRRYEVPCALEVSDREAIVPGFDFFFIPMVLNSRNPEWIIGQHHRALREYGAVMDWNQVVTEGYVMLNEQSTAARITEADTGLDAKDTEAYARLADRLLRCGIFYMEYSGTFGDMALVARIREVLKDARLFYGGGIDDPDKAYRAAQAAHTVIVGNAIYEQPELALATVQAVREAREAGNRE